MGYFPLFINLAGKKVLVAGGGKVGARKVRTLLAFGAQITVVSPKVPTALTRLAEEGKIRLCLRDYEPKDMDDAALVVASTDEKETNRWISCDAAKRNIPVNVVDQPELCSFFFPAVVDRGEFVVGITTSGSYPALSAQAREEIERLFPPEFMQTVDALKEYRTRILAEIQDPARRKAAVYALLQTALNLSGAETLEDALAGCYENFV